ncbi:MAG: polysaccharide biosynthesis tyrosine autokinase [Sporichthyaceae bacterium]
MTFQDYVRVLRERWLLVLLGLVVGLGGAAAHTFLTTPQYAASTQFFIATQDPGTEQTLTQAYQGSLLSEQKIKSYTQLATGRRIREQVAGKLGSPIADGAIAASARPDTVLLTITVTDPSPVRAKQISDLVATQFVNLVDEVEAPNFGQAAAVSARVVQSAELPDSPVSPQPIRDAVLGALLGLMLGVGLAVARHTLDRSVKSIEVLAELVDAPVLGATTFDAGAKARPLIMVDAPRSPLAESYRQLRTNLQYVDLDHSQKMVVVTSSVAGEGKTTTSVNLAIAAAQGGARVALVEADLRRPRAGDYLGMDNAVGLTTVLTGAVDLDTAMQPWGDGLFDFLASGALPPNPTELLSSRQMHDVLGELGRRYDLVLFDAPPTLPVADAAVLTAQCHGALFVARHGKVSTDQVRQAIENLDRVSGTVFGVILTMAPRSAGKRGYGYYYGYEAAAAPQLTPTPPVVAAGGRERRGRGRKAPAPRAPIRALPDPASLPVHAPLLPPIAPTPRPAPASVPELVAATGTDPRPRHLGVAPQPRRGLSDVVVTTGRRSGDTRSRHGR